MQFNLKVSRNLFLRAVVIEKEKRKGNNHSLLMMLLPWCLVHEGHGWHQIVLKWICGVLKKSAKWFVPFICALATLARILRFVLVLLSGHELESCGSRGRIKKNGVTLVEMLKKTKTRSSCTGRSLSLRRPNKPLIVTQLPELVSVTKLDWQILEASSALISTPSLVL